MSAEPDLLVLLLQHGDSFFPNGQVAFSHGLETLQRDGVVGEAGAVEGFLVDALRLRWATLDRHVVAAAWQVRGDLHELAMVDRFQDTVMLAEALRVGSQRGGRALLSVHKRLGTSGAQVYGERVLDGQIPGHQAVIQGLVFFGSGLNQRHAQIISGHGLCVGILGAAIRLGLIGHIDAQRILGRVGSIISAAVSAPVEPLDNIHGFTPMAEIAVMRHEQADERLFFN